MNERIRQLEDACWEGAWSKEGGGGYYPVFNKEKFAELIVRECADTVKYYYSRNETVTPRQILQHFGVKE